MAITKSDIETLANATGKLPVYPTWTGTPGKAWTSKVNDPVNGEVYQSELVVNTGDQTIHMGNSSGSVIKIGTANYNELSNKPTIPQTTSELSNDSNFVNATYVDNAVITDFADLTDKTLDGAKEKVYSPGTTSGSISLDIADGTVQLFELNGDITISTHNMVLGQSMTLWLKQGSTNGYTITLTTGGSVRWFLDHDNGLAPSNAFVLESVDYSWTPIVITLIDNSGRTMVEVGKAKREAT